jgi:small nuclear ribonucleoprotein (snRNP)-like protein
VRSTILKLTGSGMLHFPLFDFVFSILRRLILGSLFQNTDKQEKKRKESILDLSKYLEKNIRVKFAGGREACGILKGYDPLLNLVLDTTTEFLRGKAN